MATSTYNLIASQVVGSGGASSITFSSIPATYTDLVVKVSARDTSTADASGNYYTIAFNTGGTYSAKYLQGNGSSASSGNLGGLAGISASSASGSTAYTFSNDEIYIPNYAGSNAKSYSVDTVTEHNATGAYATLVAGLWSGTGAITKIVLAPSISASFVQYSTFYLYGINNS